MDGLMDQKNTAAAICQLRDSLGLTQEGLARELGVTVSTVYRWENGRSRPSGLALKAIGELRSRAVGLTETGVGSNELM